MNGVDAGDATEATQTLTCSECGGYGLVSAGGTVHTETCPTCGGLGRVTEKAEAPASLA